MERRTLGVCVAHPLVRINNPASTTRIADLCFMPSWVSMLFVQILPKSTMRRDGGKDVNLQCRREGPTDVPPGLPADRAPASDPRQGSSSPCIEYSTARDG